MFFDEAKIHVKAGDGGNGVVSFRREKFVPLGGPDGARGGKGGDVYLVVDPQLNTLIHFQRRSRSKAESGQHGRGKKQTGASGADLLVPVPPGTVALDAETDEPLGNLTQVGQQSLVARGGRGGRGNTSFATSTNQAPRLAEKGELGEDRWLKLELKLIADVGIIGVPNAGKSTLLARVTAAKPKIADYPFTTLQPNLGVAVIDDRDIVLADIPGLIEGAHSGSGLGDQFLRHIERTRLFIHLLNGASPDPLGDWQAINQELTLFNPMLAERPQIVVLNKMDLPDTRAWWPEIQQTMEEKGNTAFAISAVTGEGVTELLREVAKQVEAIPEPEPEDVMAVFRPEADEVAFTIEQEDDGWRVRGKRIERAAAMTDWDYYEAAMRFQRILEALGITKAMADAGVQDGDTVHIGEMELVWGWQEEGRDAD